ncbi:hypothetical protein [Teichococcus rhizosphaerae]|uniref:hypothetical protein n=1 Tax=Teichococcus rhizosphaerae TaxID=1335062 RepID=UPI0011452314|nr:hypothetical protein [Pseudoroseomonas rhizosphaerae]
MEGSESKIAAIEVGAADDELRYWKAGAAIRLGEARLASQAINRTGIETRATAIIGWAVPIALAALTLAFNPQTVWIRPAAIAACLCISVAMLSAGAVLWPRKWSVVGYPPDHALASVEGTELEFLERLAGEYAQGIYENKRQLDVLGWMLRIAWTAMAFAPMGAALVGWWTYDPPSLRTDGMMIFISAFGTEPLTS